MLGYLRLDLADNCNIRCVMCQAYNGLPVSAMAFMDFNKFVNHTGNHLAEWSCIQLGNVAEATVHPRFGDFLRYVRSQSDATIHIVTNGKLLHRYAELINETGNCMVQISMDSVQKETHEYIREGSDYNRPMANLALIDVTRTQVLLSFTLMSSNIDEYDEMVAFCQSRGYRMSAFPMILREEKGIIPYQLLKESLWFKQTALTEWLRKHYGQDYGSIVQGAASGTSVSVGLTEFNCNAHNHDLSIDSGGRASLCGVQYIGNLMERSLEEMWGSDDAHGFREKVDLDRGPCMTCDYRQRCLAPSMSLLDNHFSASIVSWLSPETRRAIAYDRNISDEDAMDRFMRDLSMDFGFFDIQREASGLVGRRMTGVGLDGEVIRAKNRHELQTLMVKATGSAHDVILTEQGYKGYNVVTYLHRFWGIPQVWGEFNITLQRNREREGLLVADNINTLHSAIDDAVTVDAIAIDDAVTRVVSAPSAVPILLEAYEYRYNIVGYLGRFWALDRAFGHMDLTSRADREREGVLSAESMEGLKGLIDAVIPGEANLLHINQPHSDVATAAIGAG